MVQSEASIRKLQADLIVKVAATTMSCRRLTEEWQMLSCGEDESSCFTGAESEQSHLPHSRAASSLSNFVLESGSRRKIYIFKSFIRRIPLR